MYSVDDLVVYGSMGVCTVTDICVPDLPGMENQCYILKPHFVANSKVYAPVEGNPVKMRLMITAKQAKTLIDSMPDIEVFPTDNKERQEMYNTYKSVVKSADCFLLARLIKTLYEKKLRTLEQKKTVPSVEKELFDIAEKNLFGELAAALDMPIEEVEGYISDRLGDSTPLMRSNAS
ncbi:MAG: hypothetical protein GXY32_04615 [Ruminococcaceae bacterium]|nr:hypothetical protein [Oscillospiraceae bacterium]